MKNFIKPIALFFTIVVANFVQAQTTAYADTVFAVSSEYYPSNAACSNGFAACRILGAPDVYPGCGDAENAWAFNCGTSRQWIEIGYNTQLYVDTLRIYETNHSGAIDTVYLRNAITGNWNSIYAAPCIPNYSCNIFDIPVPTTSYKVDAVRLAIADFSLGWCFPEYDAVALIGNPTLSSINKTDSDDLIINYLDDGSIHLKNSNNGSIKEVALTELTGRQIKHYTVNNNSLTINTNQINPGIYILNIKLDNNASINKKVLLRK